MPLITCPECHSAMEVIARGEVQIDVCPSCRGVWLDGGELEKILVATRRHEAERLENEHLAEGRHPEPVQSAPRSEMGQGSKSGKKPKKRKKKGLFDLGDLGDLVGDFFD